MTTAFHFDHLRFGYDSTLVLLDISAEIRAGEFVALVGPNGAGKSTLLKVLAGLLRTYSGSVNFFGTPLAQLGSRDLARRIAFVPQETHMVSPSR